MTSAPCSLVSEVRREVVGQVHYETACGCTVEWSEGVALMQACDQHADLSPRELRELISYMAEVEDI